MKLFFLFLFLSVVSATAIAVGLIVRRAYLEAYQCDSAEYHLPFFMMLEVRVSRREATFHETEFATHLYFIWP